MQTTFLTDEAITALLLGLALVVPVACTFARWKPFKWLGYGLWVVWLWVAFWHVVGFINVRWTDDARTTYHHEAIFKAIQDGKLNIPLAETINFPWSAVCVIMGYPRMDEYEQAILEDALGGTYLPDTWRESETYVFATPDGPREWDTAWGRFNPWFLKEQQGHEYAKRLQNQPYLIQLQTKRKKENPWQSLCYRPDEINLSIQPWPDT